MEWTELNAYRGSLDAGTGDRSGETQNKCERSRIKMDAERGQTAADENSAGRPTPS
ncbi:Hypothetical protein SMAX5B_004716 [Scophthalmus maximus]|uniref:Uncharacterized protein n=1 Tax=Scophthalmus maximus TaxID=52904 RepID=A0A2U9BAP7_SCOMX|nr:Hypothetical protein SMAX5B_004716 [Scophthalmus maximus]